MANRADTFNRADSGASIDPPSDAGGNYTVVGTYGILTNRGYAVAGSPCTAVLEASVADVTVQATIAQQGSGNMGLAFRYNAGTYLIVWCTGTSIRVFDSSFNQIGGTYAGTVTNGDVIRVDAVGTSIVVSQNGTARVTTTSSFNQTATKHGLFSYGGSDLFEDLSVTAFAPAVPTVRLVRANETTVYLSGTSGSGGSSPQWSRSLSPNTGFSNLSNGGGVSGATSDDLTDGSVTPGVRYFYKVTYAVTGAAPVQAAGTWKKPAYVLFIGDSVTQGNGVTPTAVDGFAAVVRSMAGGQRDVVTVNAGEGGTTAYVWYDATSVGSEVQTRLSNAATAGLGAGCTHAIITLGINDSTSGETTAQFQANIAGMSAYLLGRGYVAVILNYPSGVARGDDSALAKQLSLRMNIDAVVNGTTILLGDTNAIWYFQDHQDTELDQVGSPTGVHPTAAGMLALGSMWAWAWARAVRDTPVLSAVSSSNVGL